MTDLELAEEIERMKREAGGRNQFALWLLTNVDEIIAALRRGPDLQALILRCRNCGSTNVEDAERSPSRCDALHHNPLDSNDLRAWRHLAYELEHQNDLAQTEIKGLKVDLRRTKADLACAEENFHVTNQAYVKVDVERTQAQARIADLEKDLRGQREVLALMPDTIRGSTWQTDKLRQSAATLVTIISNELTNALKDRA